MLRSDARRLVWLTIVLAALAAVHTAGRAAAATPGDAVRHGHLSTLHIRYDNDCDADLEMDPERITPQRLRAIARLLPYSEGSWDGEYTSGGDPASEVLAARLARRAEVVARFEKEMERLVPPRELAPLVAWTRERWAAYGWRDRSVHEFCRARDAAALERAHGALDPGTACRNETELARRSEGDCDLATRAWVRCVDRFLPSGDYPAQAWTAFQRAHGVVVARFDCTAEGD